MRRKYFGLAIAAFATLGPMQAWGGDREIAEQIIKRLKTSRDSGALKEFTLDMKVDKGVVLFRGNVSQDSQKKLVLKASEGIEGVAKVVDEVTVTSASKVKVVKPKSAITQVASETKMAAKPTAAANIVYQAAVKPKAVKPKSEANPAFSFRQALASRAKALTAPKRAPLEVVPGEVRPAAAVEPAEQVINEPTNDQQVVSAVVAALGQAKTNGQLKGFGVDVQSQSGVLQLIGRASSAAQRDTIIRIAESIPGVSGVRESIAIPTSAPSLPALPAPPVLQEIAGQNARLVPVAVDHVDHPARRGTPARVASTPIGTPAVAAPYQMQGGPPMNGQMAGQMAGFGRRVAGQPVPMARYGGGGAGPRYDTPNLPNYAWPGYAAHPNYAAVTYPQQYSPSAWPYIGPFYPYPQVPLGWRKVSLEWDDGWWFLDFTDR